MELDRETQKTLSEGEKIRDGIKGDFWAIVKDRFKEKLESMNALSMMEFEGKSNEQIALESMTKSNTVKTIYQMIADIEGSAEQHESNKPNPIEEKDSLIINLK